MFAHRCRAACPAGARTALFTALLVAACAAKKPPKEAESTELEIEADPVCFPFATGDAAIDLDLSGNYKIAADAAHKLRAALATARDLALLAKTIENDLKAACGALDKDLAAAKKDATVAGTCGAAAAAMNAARAKLGAKTKMRVIARAPTCDAPASATADCLAACDAPTKVDATKVQCEAGRLVGGCSSTCAGFCERKAPGPCDGECVGTCDSAMSGACAGVCKGTCDGKPSKAVCLGTCEGKCSDSMSRGTCQGKCNGVCTPKLPSACDGACGGKCAADLTDPKCAGDVTSTASSDCKARCATIATQKLECHGGRVGLAIAGAPPANAKIAASYRAAVEKDIGPIHRIVSQSDRIKRVVADGRGVIEDVRKNLEAIAHTTRDKAHVENVTKAMTSCFADALKAGTESANAIDASIAVAERTLGAVTAATPGGG